MYKLRQMNKVGGEEENSRKREQKEALEAKEYWSN
jgi:hypothetical protein